MKHDSVFVESEIGTVSFCEACQQASIGYGPVMIPLKEKNFADFLRFFEQTLCEQRESKSFMRFRYSELYFRIPFEDADQLLSLIQEAQTEIWRQRLEQQYKSVTP